MMTKVISLLIPTEQLGQRQWTQSHVAQKLPWRMTTLKTHTHNSRKHKREKTFSIPAFFAPGRAEVIRWAFVAGGIEFDDRRFEYGSEQFVNDIKPMSPSGQVPMLEVDGRRYVETNAILDYACSLSGHVGTPIEALANDMIVHKIEEVWRIFPTIYKAESEEEEAKARVAAVPAISQVLSVVDNMVKMHQAEPGHICKGKSFCSADLIILDMMIAFQNKAYGVDLGNLESQFPHLWAVKEAVLRDNTPLQNHLSVLEAKL
eukprot:Gregarina_sp_Poly_1__8897@NODE_537_length_7626_cov_271_043524_g424_i0_p2_GENE_NODE_537_length_7626_cov_271_043524_g424_i0NODE_537_length_7626_cov_271_043524_g424_i0_p2_ORF_typecomplete_len261_score40_54GST_N/PF02798_20/2e10GST_N_3/PF13417_6/2_1e06GST_C_3/PF14497_6/0_0025GST_C_5/PF16865_5/0_02Tom37/PF10568_9/7_5e03Tom37/PF10568_9/0_23GST_N_4/PF17172_4/5_5e03GST_N_4/PF17172_4/0_59_NODE_537_length_7626_cov_271_043524_g424_i059806762